jgi:AcrR family transcriptional regulator
MRCLSLGSAAQAADVVVGIGVKLWTSCSVVKGRVGGCRYDHDMTAGKQPADGARLRAVQSAAAPGRSSARRSLVTRELLDRATRLFAERGYEATTLRDIADACGVSRSSLYHYVSSKEDLLAMLVEQWSRGLADSLAVIRARTDLSPERKLRQVAELTVRQRAESPEQFRVLDQAETVLPEPLRTQHRQARRDVLTEITAVIEEGIAAGDFKPVDARVAAFSVLGLCNWVAWWYRPDGPYEIDAIVRQITQSAVDMLIVSGTGQDGGTPARSALAQARGALDALERLLPD